MVMAGHIIVTCDDCGDELQLSEGCDLVVTHAELIVFTAAHETHTAFAIQVRMAD
jgi:hypothetical protein